MATMRLCFVGDSFVNGTGDPTLLGWTGRICAGAVEHGHDITYYNLGIRRDTSSDIVMRWADEVRRRLPDGTDGRVVFSFGANDTVLEQGAPRVSLEYSLRNHYKILDEALRSYPILMIGPPPVVMDGDHTERIARLSEHYGVACQELGVPYLGVVAPLAATGTFVREALDNDGAHPRSAGYAELASLVQQWDAWQSWFR